MLDALSAPGPQCTDQLQQIFTCNYLQFLDPKKTARGPQNNSSNGMWENIFIADLI